MKKVILRRRASAGLLLGVAAVRPWNESGRQNIKVEVKPEVKRKTHYTSAELLEFDGEKSEKIYIALNGYVYDVTSSADLYKRQPDDMDDEEG